ncbi:MAG TPA: adenylate/guanylate cyclase domain-containing protein [Candidatus Dormibacteraeota bacterium]|nr:adenylate/guanylate cyclase domain-containing protein [Candidatus Dormibacteraeota bacterium]
MVIVSLLVFAAGIAVAVTAYQRMRVAIAEGARVRALFSRYLSPSVVDELLARKGERALEGHSVTATILYARIWNFTLHQEQLTPEQTLQYVNEFYTLAGEAIQRHRGTIDRFLPDGIVAIFGAPLEDPHQEEHAVRAAIDIVRYVSAMSARWSQQKRRPLKVGCAVGTGKVIAGDTGFQERRAYTVVGAEVTFVERLQEVTENINALVLVNEATYEPIREIFTAVPTSALPLRGIKRVARAYVIRGLARHAAADELLLPSPHAFRSTIVHEAQPEPPEPPRLREPARFTEEAPPGRAKPKPETPVGFSLTDASAAELPELPLSITYEDDDGPPIPLPPG